MSHRRPHEPDASFLKRCGHSVRRHWWQYGLGAVIASAVLAWATTEACNWAKACVINLRVHYRQSEENTARIDALGIDLTNLMERTRRQWETNKAQDAAIAGLQKQIERIKK